MADPELSNETACRRDIETMMRLTDALLVLARHGIPVDIQGLLLRGDSMRGIRPGALKAVVEKIKDQ